MRNLHIENSYNVWAPAVMREIIIERVSHETKTDDVETFLNRSFKSLYIEWWLHNIGYYLTKPIKYAWAERINLRCRDVDLEEWKK